MSTLLSLEEAILQASAIDTTPNAFTFTDQSGVSLSSTITSAAITVAGLTTGISVPITVSGGTYDINGSGSFTSSAGTVQNGDTVRARHTSSASSSTAVNTTVTIGGVSDTFTSTTRADITAQINNSGGYVRAAGAITLTWDNTGVFSSNRTSGGGVTPYNWLLSGAPADGEIFFHQTTGTAMTGVTLDAWLQLNVTRTIQQAWPGGVGSSTFALQVTIRDRLSGTVVAGPTTLTGGTTP